MRHWVINRAIRYYAMALIWLPLITILIMLALAKG